MLTQETIVHLSLIDGIGPVTIQSIVKKHTSGSSLSDVYGYTAADFTALYGVPYKVASALVRGLADKALLERELALCKKHNISWISIISNEYPQALKNIYAPPAIIYLQGDATHLNSMNKKLAVVGSRACNEYGAEIITTFIPELVSYDVTIVSGGAYGIDTLAHKTTLDYGGKTVAVLGSGLLKPYPASNKKLFESIIEHDGLMISIFPVQTPPSPGNFPARNRIIAGLSDACLVVQAAQKSGALITAQYALDQAKDVFAVPGAINQELSAGCNYLIQQGAHVALSSNDIVYAFGYQIQSSTPEKKPCTLVAAQQPYAHLSEVQQTIIALCKNPVSMDEILVATDLDLSALQQELFTLQLEHIIKQDFTGMWNII